MLAIATLILKLAVKCISNQDSDESILYCSCKVFLEIDIAFVILETVLDVSLISKLIDVSYDVITSQYL